MQTSKTQKYLLPSAALVFCLQAIAILSNLDPEFAKTDTALTLRPLLLTFGFAGFIAFSVTKLMRPDGFAVAMVAYGLGAMFLLSGVHERQTHTIYRIACNVGGNAAACAAASKSASTFGWTKVSDQYAVRTCTKSDGWALLDCQKHLRADSWTATQRCEVAKRSCELGRMDACEARPIGCEPDLSALAVESCEAGSPNSCAEIAALSSSPWRRAEYSAKACELSAGRIGCHAAILSGFAQPRIRACEAVATSCAYADSAVCGASLRQCDAILNSPYD